MLLGVTQCVTFLSLISSLALPSSALPTGSSPSYTLRTFNIPSTTDDFDLDFSSAHGSPFKRLLSSDICATIDLKVVHEVYIQQPGTGSGKGVIAGDFGIGVANPDSDNVKHGTQAAGAIGPDYVDPKFEPAQIGSPDDGTFIQNKGKDGGPVLITGNGKQVFKPTRRTTTYAAVEGAPNFILDHTEKLTFKLNVCICLSGGQLTEASKKAIEDAVDDPVNAAIVKVLTTLTNGHQDFADLAAIISFLERKAIKVVGGKTTQCKYPKGSIPDSCTDCHSTCPSGEKLCGDQCIDPSTTICKSGMPSPLPQNRGFFDDLNPMCPPALTACAIPSSAWFTSQNYECIDTRTDLESCGACAFPLPGQAAGVDCTSLPWTLGVGCHAGKCVVDGCERGYELNTDATGCVPQSGSSGSERGM